MRIVVAKFLLLVILIGISIRLLPTRQIELFQEETDRSLKTEGFLRLRNKLTSNEMRLLRKLIFDTVESDSVEFGNIDVKNNRRLDMKIPLTKFAKKLIRKLYKRLKKQFDLYDTDPILMEHSTFLNFPNSDPQNWHRDVDAHDIANNGKLFTVGVALDDIQADMGALQFLPKSHLSDDIVNQRDCNDQMTEFCGYFHDDVEFVDWTCKRGDVLVWDATLVHRSGGNRSGKMRGIYYFSVLCKTTLVPPGTTHSLMDKYKKRPIRLNNI